MTTNEEIHQAVLVIDSRLQTIDGKVNLVARANREGLQAELETVVRRRPLIGHIYLLLDGTRNQDQLVEALNEQGTETSPQAVGRWLREMSAEHGMAEQTPVRGRGKTYRKSRAIDQALNLTKRIEGWLADIEKATGRGGK